MDPRELTLFVTAVANGLYDSLPPLELALLAAVFNQLGDTIETLAAQKALLEGAEGQSPPNDFKAGGQAP